MKYLLLFPILLATLLAAGQNHIADTINIEEIMVTSQRIPLERLLVPYSVGLVNPLEMEHFAKRTTPELLMNTEGVFMQKTNHGGGSPFIRGLTGNQTLLLIDGIRLNNSVYRYGPNQYLNTVDVYTINHIEIAKSTGAVQYGSDALGGAIQLFTHSPELSPGEPAWLGKIAGKVTTGGMEKTGRGQLQYNGKKAAFLAGGTYRNFGDLIGGKETGVQTPSGYQEIAFDGKLLFALTRNIHLTLASQLLHQPNVPIYHKVVLENYKINAFKPQQRQLHYARLNIRNSQKVFNQVKLIASWQKNVEDTETQKNDSFKNQLDKNKINTVGFVAELTSRVNKIWIANSGVELYHDKVFSQRIVSDDANEIFRDEKRGLYPNGSEYYNFSVYSLHNFKLGNWILDGGARFNTFNIKIGDENLGDVVISPKAVVFNLAAMYHISAVNHVYASFNNGFRAPNIDDLGSLGIVDFRYEVPAYDLKPEKSASIEMGYRLSTCKLSAGIAGYYLKLNQLITRVKVEGEIRDGYQVYQKENVDEAYITGGEMTIKWKASQKLELNGALSYTYGQSITKNEPLRRIPPFNGKAAAVYTTGQWFISGEYLFAGKQNRLAQGDIDDNRIPDGGTPGWQVLNIYSGYRISFVDIKVGFENLFDVDYRTHGSGINGIGRSAWVSLGIEW